MAAVEVIAFQSSSFPHFLHTPPDSPTLQSSSRKRKSSLISSEPSNPSSTRAPYLPVEMGLMMPQKVSFDPKKHLNHVAPKKVLTMADIGKKDCGVSPNAVSEPFPLFNAAAVKQMRTEVLSKEVMENCQYSSNLAACQLRGYSPKYAPFIYDAWHSPEVLAIVSKIAGIDLVPVMDFEIGHINISINSKEDQGKAKAAIAAGKVNDDDGAIVGWHTDSYPFVCVLMLSDCTEMVGGETALRTGTGEILKVRGPGVGNGVVLQGKYIEHQALKAIGGPERITMVTSFRPKDPSVRDDSILQTVRAVSNLSELYGGYSEYRLEMLEERIKRQQKADRQTKKLGRRFNTKRMQAFLVEQRDFINHMLKELVDEDKVIPGYTDPEHLISEDLREKAQKHAEEYMGNKA